MSRITANAKILGGKPVIKGTRISVEFILELMASGVNESEILADYPHLTREDIQAWTFQPVCHFLIASCSLEGAGVSFEAVHVFLSRFSFFSRAKNRTTTAASEPLSP